MDYNILDFGAKAEQGVINTLAIQKAIDVCFSNGGGRVVISGGTYLSGSIELKSNVNLYIEEGAVLLGSPNCEDYPERKIRGVANNELLPRGKSACFIFAESAKNICITGGGKIDANGDKFVEPIDESDPRYYGYPFYRIKGNVPPRVVFFLECVNVIIKDVTLTNLPAGWGYWINACSDVTFDRANVLSSVNYMNNDGIHINSSKNVYVTNCTLVCGDDCIAIRCNNVALKENLACENIIVSNCVMTSNAYCVRLGWHNDGVIKNCAFNNLIMKNSEYGVGTYLPNLPKVGRCTDQGIEKTRIENVTFDNIVMDEMYSYPISINIPSPEDENCLVADCDKIDDLHFNNVTARGLCFPSFVSAEKGLVKNIYFTNCVFTKVSEESLINYKTNGVAVHHHKRFRERELAKNVENLSLINTIFAEK